jgi:ATP/maltotriose-dependent transcriptional regulator MalT
MAQEAVFAVYSGHLAEGLERLEHLLVERQARLPDSPDLALHLYIVMCQKITGDVEAAMTHAREGLVLAERVGVPRGLALAYEMLGMAHVLREAMPEARAWLERGLRLVRETQIAMRQEPPMLALLALAEAGGGELAQARATAERAIDLSRQYHAGENEIHGLLALARVLLRSQDAGAHGAIQGALDAMAELVEAGGYRAYPPVIHVERAELARQRGDLAARERELRQAQQLFREIGAPIRVAQIARELES